MIFKIIIGLFFLHSTLLARSQGLLPGDYLQLDLLNTASYRQAGKPIDLKGKKLILLDFWHHRCSACFSSFPKLDSLQAAYSDSLQIILVCRESRKETDRLFSQLPRIKVPDVPFIYSDSLIHSKFPHNGSPYYVWLDGSGRFLQSTSQAETGREAIADYIQFNKLKGGIHVRQLQFVSSLFGQQAEERLEAFSYLSRFDDGLVLTGSKLNGYKEMIYENISITELFRRVYAEKGRFDFQRPGRLVFEVKDYYPLEAPINSPEKSQWRQKHLYTYHIRVRGCHDSILFAQMKLDLSRYFPYMVSTEKRLVPCYILRTTGPAGKALSTKGGVPSQLFYTAGPYFKNPSPERYLVNQPWSNFTYGLRMLFEHSFPREQQRFFLDETDINGRIDISLYSWAMDNLNLIDLNQALSAYYLSVSEELRELEVVVIRDLK